MTSDVASVREHIAGQWVLVTGAGGSIGAELCRQLHQLGPAQLIMLDRDESALHAVQLMLHGRALLDSEETVLADIRDRRRVRRSSSGSGPASYSMPRRSSTCRCWKAAPPRHSRATS